MDYLIDPSFQGVNRLFVLSFKDADGQKGDKLYYLPTVEVKDYNVMINGRHFFHQPIKDDLKTYDNVRKIATGQADDYKTGCLLDYPYFQKYYKLIAIDLRKQQKLDPDPKEMQEINFTGNSEKLEDSKTFFIIEEVKETVLDFSKGTIKVL